MDSWIAVRQVIPWLPAAPYLVAPSDLANLVALLRPAGFAVFEADVESCKDERGLLAQLGDALGFPEYYGVNWGAFEDCLGGLLEENRQRMAVILTGVDTLVRADLHAFVRTVHLLQSYVTEVERRTGGRVQFEVFFVTDFVEPQAK